MTLNLNKDNITYELLTRLKNGDMLAFDRVYELYSHKLFSFVFKILKNEAEADDIVQEVFVKIWESRQKLEDYRLLNSYIFTIAYNNSIDLIRKRINNTKYLEHLKNSSVINVTPNLISQIEFNELNSQADKLIANLPERQKQVYLLHREEGLTYPEIAERLGISKNTVENHMVKALKYLRQNMDNSLLINMLFVSLFI
ncbi:MAG TPA: RNA polymerase sigma-70 factor [Prolixibacteraceae bacterium]|nr:RNA polymerase sigma-70 factor [Prolixibacteraceae bacterium]